MSSVQSIGEFAIAQWENIGQPTDVNVSTISGWVTQPQTIGQLNSYLGTCYSGVGYTGACSWNNDISPDLTPAEFGILDQMWQVRYYSQLIRKCAGAGGTQKIVQQLAEGDSKVTYVSAVQLAKVYTENLTNAQKRLNFLVNVYNENSAGTNTPRSVDYYMIEPKGYDDRYYNVYRPNSP